MYAEAKERHDQIRYCDTGSYRWLWAHAPCSWRGNVELLFSIVPMASLRPAGCLTDPAIVAAHLRHIREGRAVAPLIVCANREAGWYIHDGNHRYRAMQNLFAGNDEAEVRVAVAVPNAGFKFVYRWFETYGTYLLEPVSPLLDQRAFRGRTMVAVAHQDPLRPLAAHPWPDRRLFQF